MLDQNTDRMWYVIGAVIIGAAIILIMNNVFPQLFASVGETFKGKTEQTTEIVDGIMPMQRNLINSSDIIMRYNATADLSKYTATNGFDLIRAESSSGGSGIQMRADALGIKPNKTYLLEYTYQKISGTLVSFGGHSVNDFNANVAYLNGVKSSVNYHDGLSVYGGNNTQLHSVKVYFTTPDTIKPDNDQSGIWIQPNRGRVEAVTVRIGNLRLNEVKN